VARSPSCTMWLRPRPTSILSGILKHPAAFGYNKHEPQIGGSAPFWGEGVGSPSNTLSLGSRLIFLSSGILIHPAIWPQQMGRKLGSCAGSPSNAMWPGPRLTCMPSFILIRPTIWPQHTNVYRQDRTEPFYKRSTKNVTDGP